MWFDAGGEIAAFLAMFEQIPWCVSLRCHLLRARHAERDGYDVSAQTWTSSTSISTAAVISSRQVHSSGECGLCSPVEMFGVGRPRSVSCDPSVPPRIDVSLHSRL